MPSTDCAFRVKLDFENAPPGMPASTKYMILVIPGNCKTIHDLELQIIRKFGYSKGATLSLSLDDYNLLSTEDVRVLSHNDCISVAILQEVGDIKTKTKSADITVKNVKGKKRKADITVGKPIPAKKPKATKCQSKHRACLPAKTSSNGVCKDKSKNPGLASSPPITNKKPPAKLDGLKTKHKTSKKLSIAVRKKDVQEKAKETQIKKPESSSDSSSDSSSSSEESEKPCAKKESNHQDAITAKTSKQNLTKPTCKIKAPANIKPSEAYSTSANKPADDIKPHTKLNCTTKIVKSPKSVGAKMPNSSNAHHTTFESSSSDSDMEVTTAPAVTTQGKKSDSLNTWLISAASLQDQKISQTPHNGNYKDPGVSTNISTVLHNPPLRAENAEPMSKEPEKPDRDYASLLPLSWPPRRKDLIAYKMLEMSQDYTPVISDYNEAIVLEVLSAQMSPIRVDSVKVQLVWPKSHGAKREGGRFEMNLEDEDEQAEAAESDQIFLEWRSLLDPKRIE